MTRARCRYALRLGSHVLMAGCGRVHVKGQEWEPFQAVMLEKVDNWFDGVCPECARKFLALRDDYNLAKQEQTRYRAAEGALKIGLPADPFAGLTDRK